MPIKPGLSQTFQEKVVGSAIFIAKKVLKRGDYFSQLLRLQGPLPRRSPKAKRILIYTYKWWPAHLAVEAVLARALQLRGAEVSFFACDHPQEACDNFRLESQRYLTCADCLFSRRKYLDELGFETLTSSQFLEANDLRHLKSLPLYSDFEALRAVEEDGVPVGLAAQTSALRHLRINSLESDRAVSTPVVNAYLKHAIETHRVTRRMMAARSFDSILLQCGKSATESLLIDAAVKNGVPYNTYDFGYLLGTLMFRNNAAISDANIAHIWGHYSSHQLTAAEEQQIVRYLDDRRYGRLSILNQWPNPKFANDPVGRREVHERGGRVALLCTNTSWDTAFFGSETVFSSMLEWLEFTIRHYLNRPQDLLIVRIHPAEVRVSRGIARERADDFIRARFPELPEHIRIILPEDPLSTYSILEHVDLVLAYTSTIGLEAACLGCTVVTAGLMHYRGYGFTLDIASRDYYLKVLTDSEEADQFQRKTEIRRLALKYAYLFFFKLMVPFPYVRLAGTRFLPTFTFDSLDDLRPGRDAHLDMICDGLLENKENFVRE